jgi:hypothetical protein
MTAPSDGDLREEYLANRAVPHMRLSHGVTPPTIDISMIYRADRCRNLHDDVIAVLVPLHETAAATLPSQEDVR